MAAPTILWLRRDLRLSDHLALQAALARGGAVLPLFIWSSAEEGEWAPGAASRWWLHHSLLALRADLAARGGRLLLRRGPAAETLVQVLAETGATAVCWQAGHEPALRQQDTVVSAALRTVGAAAVPRDDGLLLHPALLQTQAGTPYQVFTRYWQAAQAYLPPPAPRPAPAVWPAPDTWPGSLEVTELGLLPRLDWAGGLRLAWTPGEAGAQAALARFVGEGLSHYATARDFPAEEGSSRLSPHLQWGELSVRQAWHAVATSGADERSSTGAAMRASYLRQLGWRDFAHYLLWHFPHTPTAPLRADFSRFPWRTDAAALRCWQRGHTGYPLVDAGLRELWYTGWMHNRVRMVVGSFLVKDLLLSWEEGARWFWDTLVDANLANNTLGWQWVGGCGADAAPYFRVFNPVTQSEKFDPAGKYLARWVPELAAVPLPYRHAPWTAPPLALAAAGVVLGRDYPAPMVDHATARLAALAAFAQLKATRPAAK